MPSKAVLNMRMISDDSLLTIVPVFLSHRTGRRRAFGVSVVCVSFQPRYAADDMFALRQAADDGIGIAQLADYVVMDQIASGALEIIPPRIGRCRAELCTPFLLTPRAVHGDP